MNAPKFGFAGVLALVASLAACSTVLGVDFDEAHLAPATAETSDSGVLSAADCVPKTCADQGFVCGTQSDGCGGALECGACEGDARCMDGKCACQPKTCPEVGATCGLVDDGCGGSLDCGTCANASDACIGGACVCQPKNCAARGANCGTVPDGCGNTYDCGDCSKSAAGPNCGGGGPNKCGAAACVPRTCDGHCGQMSDGCGKVLDCGGCKAPQTCGGGGDANVCGCTPTTCAREGKNCGTIPNGCGGTLNCGSCKSPDTCGGGGKANICGCTPAKTCAKGQECGTVSNGCGGNVACGLCKLPETCGGSGTPNVCGCEPRSCLGLCGTVSDGCGGTMFCGLCGGGGGGGCFPAGTLITMADGSRKPIERVSPGEWVRSADPETGEVRAARVTGRKVHPSTSSEGGIVVVNGAVHATRNHPIWARGQRLHIEEVKIGDDIVVSGAGGRAIHEKVRSVELRPGGVETYDLVLDGGKSYFVDGVMMLIKQRPENPL